MEIDLSIMHLCKTVRPSSSSTHSQKLVATEHRLWRQTLEAAECLIFEAKSDIEALIEGTLDTNAILSSKLKSPTWEAINESLGSGTDEEEA